MQLRRGREGHGGGDGQGRGACEDGARVDVDSAGSRGEGSGGDQGQVAQAADKGPSASLAPSAARSTYREYASRAAVGRRLAAGPFSPACHPSPCPLPSLGGERDSELEYGADGGEDVVARGNGGQLELVVVGHGHVARPHSDDGGVEEKIGRAHV